MNSEKHPLNQQGHMHLRILYEKFDPYTKQKHNEWLAAYKRFCSKILT